MRCLTYYSEWTGNQGQILTINENKTVSRIVKDGVAKELGDG